MYLIFTKHHENTSNYNSFTHGYSFEGTCEDLKEFKIKVLGWQHLNLSELENGIVLDVNGSEAYDPDSPEYFEFTDFDIVCVNAASLDPSKYDDDLRKVRALEKSEDYEAEEVLKKFNLSSKI